MSVRPYKICENNIKNINMINHVLFTDKVLFTSGRSTNYTFVINIKTSCYVTGCISRGNFLKSNVVG